MHHHVSTPGFGYDILQQSTPTTLDTLWSEAKVTDPIAIQILLLEAYETVYGICDHDGEAYDNPLSLVTMHPKEDTSSYSRLYGELMRFANEELFREMWGVSILELLEMPKDVVEEMYRITRDIMAARNEDGESMSRKLMREAQKVGK